MSDEPIETETLIEAFQDNAAPCTPQHGAVVPEDDFAVDAYSNESAPTTPRDKPADPAKKPEAPACKEGTLAIDEYRTGYTSVFLE